MRELTVEPLTKEAFAPFGDVIETDNSEFFYINDRSGQRFHALGAIDVSDTAAPLISIVRAAGFDNSLSFDLLEKHPKGSQAFFPLNGERFIVIVAQGDDNIEESTLRAFITNGNQGVNYHRNVWHYLLFAKNKETDFLTIDRAGEDNCIVKKLSANYTISF
ncbi:ureidoglycolate lyase [Photobacterium sp. DNB23_23_1]|uniref:Ureidoglycolate lyase n=1 Tax=Photobacterium pectinilyticum TaxID=2906793 RepID=A0ABT1N7K8_9GAMM|nr:ureidoglycolate lyase [Photobacterium sp. ZSDE20]MCQ1060740.1 ureidoglycolate lyase [Photobacterium sp. ZSDE20]MDD1828310.1 ureidoglycolate lyase [Photobacterium sp. ZSDE20]